MKSNCLKGSNLRSIYFPSLQTDSFVLFKSKQNLYRTCFKCVRLGTIHIPCCHSFDCSYFLNDSVQKKKKIFSRIFRSNLQTDSFEFRIFIFISLQQHSQTDSFDFQIFVISSLQQYFHYFISSQFKINKKHICHTYHFSSSKCHR